jgi:hypothetical protein
MKPLQVSCKSAFIVLIVPTEWEELHRAHNFLFNQPPNVKLRHCRGAGTLGMPHAVAQTGWFGLLIIVLALFYR